MACITFCKKCEKNSLHSGLECLECKSKNKRDEKEEFLIGRSKLSIEERISLIESNIFDINNKPQIEINNKIFGSSNQILEERFRNSIREIIEDDINTGRLKFYRLY